MLPPVCGSASSLPGLCIPSQSHGTPRWPDPDPSRFPCRRVSLRIIDQKSPSSDPPFGGCETTNTCAKRAPLEGEPGHRLARSAAQSPARRSPDGSPILEPSRGATLGVREPDPSPRVARPHRPGDRLGHVFIVRGAARHPRARRVAKLAWRPRCSMSRLAPMARPPLSVAWVAEAGLTLDRGWPSFTNSTDGSRSGSRVASGTIGAAPTAPGRPVGWPP